MPDVLIFLIREFPKSATYKIGQKEEVEEAEEEEQDEENEQDRPTSETAAGRGGSESRAMPVGKLNNDNAPCPSSKPGLPVPAIV